ncbi:AAA family ATPase [Flagellimonas sp. S3867]|uniref:AAA family ATPase n=1 Tax=Flagellimonas sp. S3867 TaxID=2768063 RepID=UPI001681E76B|nr:AAA family ATPase [Flagellimonas sp. S3867]
MALTKKSIPKYSIKDLSFYNFKGIQDIAISNLPKGAPWIFLTGENGFGKTSVLQAIASSLIGLEEHTFKFFSNRNNTSIKTKLHGSNRKYEVSGSNLNYANNSNGRFPYLACYGSSRLDTYTESSLKSNDSFGISKSLYDSRAYLENIEFQFTRWHAKEKHKDSQEKYEYIKELLVDILELDDIIVDYESDKVQYIEKDHDNILYEKVTSEELASGYRSLIAMIGDMILRLFRTQLNINNPSKLEGLVIIDELDLHFHPKWQKKLPGILTKHFPKIQFIASTHSPIPLLGAPKNSVVLRVDRNVQSGISITRVDDKIYLEELLPNTILTSPIFGMENITNDFREQGSMVRTESTYDELKFSDQLKGKIEGFMTDQKEHDLIERFKKKRS